MAKAPERILLVEINTDGTVGGSHRAMADLITHLDRARYEPVALFYQQNPYVETLRADGVQVEIWPYGIERGQGSVERLGLLSRVVNTLRAIARCVRFLVEQRIALVHLNNSPTVNFEDWLPACLLLRRPCVTHARGGEMLRPGRIGRFLMRRFDAVIAISDYMADAMVEAGVPAHLIEKIYDGVDIDRFRGLVSRPPEAVRAELDVAAGSMLAVMAGHLRSWKGQDRVLAALSRLDRSVLDRLVVAFAGGVADDSRDYLALLEGTVAEHALESSVRFLGDRDDVPDLMNAADFVIHASTLAEPFGLVVVEGLSLGKPVLATRLGGPLTILPKDGMGGRLFDPARPQELAMEIEAWVTSREGLAAVAGPARTRAETFRIENTVEGVESLYDRLRGD